MKPQDAAIAEQVAAIVLHWPAPAFVSRLKAADVGFARPGFEGEVALQLRAAPELIEAWSGWSSDQRWSPSAYLDGTEVGWYDGGRQHVRTHADAAAAAADFVHRLAAWMARRQVLTVDDTGPGPDR